MIVLIKLKLCKYCRASLTCFTLKLTEPASGAHRVSDATFGECDLNVFFSFKTTKHSTFLNVPAFVCFVSCFTRENQD